MAAGGGTVCEFTTYEGRSFRVVFVPGGDQDDPAALVSYEIMNGTFEEWMPVPREVYLAALETERVDLLKRRGG